MSSPARRRERAAEFEAEQDARRAEERRKEQLSMWERIEECGASEAVRDILHRLANGERES